LSLHFKINPVHPVYPINNKKKETPVHKKGIKI